VRTAFVRTNSLRYEYNSIMPEYRRVKQPGGIYFLTLNTYQRQKLFFKPETSSMLLDSVQHVRKYHPFDIIAYCVLPDHAHFLWKMLEDDWNYSMRIGLIKGHFSKKYISQYREEFPRTESQRSRREVTVWQRRFWEHFIRDEEDLARHIEYIHYNPVKHGWVNRVREWEGSSFYDFVNEGIYEADWGEGFKVDNKKYRFGE
jgi:putative transposase